MADKLVAIAQFADYIEADLARQMLDDFGIKAVVTGQNASNVYGGLVVEGPELQVMESNAKEALEILGSNQKEQEE